jgi:ATP-binding cassette subfamily F protein 3
MLRINKISKCYGAHTVLDGASFVVNDGEVAGIVGANGAGKTTLLRVIAGEVAAEAGSVETRPAARIGYLRQGYTTNVADSPTRAVFPALFAHPAIDDEIIRLSERMASETDAHRTAELARLYEEAIARLDAAASDKDAKRMAAELELRPIAADELVGELSGGEQTKLALIELSLERPDVLLLDEPTNNLDLRGMAWLDAFLDGFGGPVLVVSHDRTLLDAHASQIIEIDAATARIEVYEGGYSEYAAEKRRRRDAAWAAYRRQREHDQRLEREIRDIKATAMRREKLSQHDFYRRKAKKVARRAVVLERRLRREQGSSERVEKPIVRPYGIKPEITGGQRSGDRMLAARDLRVCVDGRELLQIDEFSVGWQERVVIAGPNGSGKTTLLRTLLGELPAGSGDVTASPSTRIGYLAQASSLATENEARTPVELVRRAGGLSETEARRFLHRFLFSGDDALTPIARLSFGEQQRLALANLVLSGANLLLLDEPTNHLDIPSREAFESGLAAYDGAMLAVTHDRYFIDRLAERLLMIEDSRLRERWA